MSDHNPKLGACAEPVVRDTERFKLLFRNSRPDIPADASAPMGIQTTREVIGQRLRQAAEEAQGR